jgi:acetylornithine/N-succinyldiaminopimelate aminotransferase
MDDKFLDSVKEKGAYIKEKLLVCDKVKSVSGKGLMIGIELNTEKSSKDVAMKCIENGLIILTAKNKLRLLPPLSITKEEIDKGLNILINVLKEV